MDLGCLPGKYPASGKGAEIVLSNYTYTPYNSTIQSITPTKIMPVANFSVANTGYTSIPIIFTVKKEESPYALALG
jgi:hypothetical protein